MNYCGIDMGLDEALQDTDFRNHETGVFQVAGAV